MANGMWHITLFSDNEALCTEYHKQFALGESQQLVLHPQLLSNNSRKSSANDNNTFRDCALR